jgi:anti-sigma B factor antagonist
MNTATRVNKGTTIIDVTGHIDLSSSPALRKTLLDSIASTGRLAINLAEVKYIDSSGIASLLEVLKEARNTKKKLVLFGLTPAVREVLQLTRLSGVFEICETENEVVEAPVAGRG